ncbi:MAG TPA: universal stress protein [Steroidobacteraceae bacterium]|nr:universal stress protein [Steroidobacteraceae bacterium]
MQKLTEILAVVEHASTGGAVLDKALALARRFRARVELLVAEPRLLHEFAARCAARGHDEVTFGNSFRGDEPLRSQLLRRVEERQPDLLVKAPERPRPWSAWTLHGDDRELASECPVPVLLAGARPWAEPPRFAAAVDVSGPETAAVARAVLHAAGMLAQGTHGQLDILYSEREQHDEIERMARAVRLAQLVREYHVGCERLQMFSGAPEKRLPPLVAARQYDVLVLGAVSHRDANPLAIGTLTAKLVDATPGDVVLVKAADPARAPARRPAASGREQAAHHGEQLV